MTILRVAAVTLLGLFLLSTAGAQTLPQSPSTPRVLILGTYHMANPGRDIYNVRSDDVLAPRRQKEIAEVITILKRFRPTKIAVEAAFGSETIRQSYEQYLAGEYALTPNEIDQIGFRLAKNLGHNTIYPIDAEGDFPFNHLVEVAQKTGQEQIISDALAPVAALVAETQARLDQGSITDALKFLNDPRQVGLGHAAYIEMATIVADGDYAGADLLAEWYRRNIRIFSNLRRIMDSPDDRVLVIFGSGHLYWLQRSVLDSGEVTLEQFNDYAGR